MKDLFRHPRRGLSRAKKPAVTCTIFLLLIILTWHLLVIFFVPVSWREADLSHLVRVIGEAQHFPVEELNKISRQQLLKKINQVNMGETHSVIDLTRVVETSMNKSTGEHYPEFFKELRDTGSSLRTDPSWKEYSRVLNAFRPILTPYEKAQLLLALDVFTSVCDAAGVTYFVFEASLMGVRRHHGMVPWDDDIDIVVNASQWRELHAVLSSVPGFELFAPSDVQWKFYLSAAHSFPDKPFKFPYLDIFFFSEDEEFLWAITHGLKHDLVNPKTDIFPLLRRPFEGRLVQVPNNLHLLVEESHDVTECITGEYNHKTNERFKYLGKVSVLCSVLYNVYPFVERQRIGQERVQETLKIGEKVLHRMTFEERG